MLLDIVMPKIDGGDVARQIQADPSLDKTRIVFLTAIVSQKEALPGNMIGGFPFMAKPISLEALTKFIEANLPDAEPPAAS